MSNKIIKDYSVSKEQFRLDYDGEMDLHKTNFTNWDTLESYYQSENYISHTDGNRNWFEKIYQFVKNFTIKQKWIFIKKHFKKENELHVLDIGCGTGDFLKYGIQNNKVNGVGIEPNEKAREISKTKKIEVYNTIGEIKNKKFDVISLWHVLEHVKDIDDYFTFFKDHLKDDGLLIIAVPNFNSYDATFYKEHWAAWDVPRHLWHFSKKAISIIAKKHDFKLIHIKPMYFDSFYVSMLSEEYKTGRKNILKAFFIGFLSNLKAKRTKEYSSHIYFFKK